MIRKINGKNSYQNISHLNTDDGVLSSKTDIANTLAETFAEKSSTNYSSKFQKFKNVKEKIKF